MITAILAALVIPRTTPIQKLTTRGPQWVAELFSCSWCLGFHFGLASGLLDHVGISMAVTHGLLCSVAAGSAQVLLNALDSVTEAARAYTSKVYSEKP